MSAISALATGAASAVGGAAVSSLLGGGGGGGGGGGVSQVQQGPPTYAESSYKRGISDLKDLRERGLLGQVQELSPYERAAIQRGMALAEQPDQFYDPASLATQQLLGGAQSFLDPAARAYQDLLGAPSSVSQVPTQVSGLLDPTQEKIISQFARGGRLGSGAMGESLGRGMTTAIAPYLQKAQAQDIERQLASARGLTGVGEVGIRSLGLGVEAAPVVSTMPYTSIDRALGLGGALSAQEFAESQIPVSALREYADILGGLTVGGTTTQPLYSTQGPTTGQVLASSIGGQMMKSGFKDIADYFKSDEDEA